MRPIRLPDPSVGFPVRSEIFDGGVSGAIRRAVVIGNGFAGAENQCVGLVRALGLSGRHSIYVSAFCSFEIFVFISIMKVPYSFVNVITL